MRSRFFRTLLVCVAASALLLARGAQSLSALTNGGSINALESPLVEDFDTLVSTGSATWVNNSTIPGWYSARTGTGTTIVADAGGSSAGNLYSYGAAGGTDRALGSVGSGNAAAGSFFWGVRLTNNTGSPISSVTVSYTGEEWRNGGGTGLPQTVDFQYQVAAAGTITGVNTPATGWLDYDALDFTSPTFSTTAGALDGNAAANRVLLTATIPVTVAAGQELWLRWKDIDHPSNDHGLAIDDFSVVAHGTATITPPGGTFSVAPSSLNIGDPFTATVNVTPGSNPIASVTADLSAINLGIQTFSIAGTNTYTFSGSIPNGVTGGQKTLTATITDSGTPALTANPQTSVTIVTHSAPTGNGSASPGTVAPGAATTLTVNVTPGANPPSTGVAVTGDLSAIGGNASQPFSGNGNAFTFAATVAAGTSEGTKSIPIAIADAQGASSQASISLNVATPFVPPSVRISQVYGGGGNSGATFLNDFVELFNSGTTPVDVTTWSVQEASATSSTWNVAPLCPVGTCTIQPGHYFLVWESAGTGTSVQVPLPAADATGTALVSAASAKFALMANTTPLTAACPAGQVVDFVGYGGANCSETQAAPGLSNTTSDIRIGNGCTDTDNNSADFVSVTPIPRNSASPPHACGDASTLRALGRASPTGPERGGLVTLTVQLTPASTGPTSGFTVAADLSSIGGSSSQSFVDDGTNGDAAAGDNTFSYQLRTPFTLTKGVHTLVATVTDGTTTINEPMTFTAALPTCGTERWAVKVGDDSGASSVDLVNPATPTTIQALVGASAPTLNPNPPYDPRFAGVETTRWVLNATMTAFKKETDVDYHIVIADTSGTMIAEIPEPDCASDASPFRPGILTARQTFDGRFTASPDFQNVTVPVRIAGVGFFDFLHGQNGVAPNGVEVHPVLDVIFQSTTTTAVVSSANPSKYQDDVALTATVTSPGAAPTGQMTFLDGGTPLGTLLLDGTGHATIHTSTLAVGPHSITAKYLGDDSTTPSSSTPLVQNVGQADQTIAFDPIPDKTFGDPDFSISASSSSGLGVTLTKISGPATLSGTTVHITGAGGVTIRATQDGDGNYTAAAPVERTFAIAKASQTITFNGAVPTPLYGALPFDVTASGGASGNPVTFTGSGACTAQGQNGIATVTIVSGGSCHVIASQAGNSNYAAAPDTTETITVGRATSDVHVKPVVVVYDGQPHGLQGTAIGVNAEDLGALLNLGATFTNVPGGSANWTFAGNVNYLPSGGQESVTISKATPAFSNLSGPSIEAGTASTTLNGNVTLGALIPTGTVTITLGTVAQTVPVGAGGHFAASFATGTLLPSAYPVVYAYNGDANFVSITGSGTLLVRDTTPPAMTGVTASPDVLGPPNHNMIDVALAYQASPDLTGEPACAVSVTSNEPVNGTGDGNTAIDWTVIDPHHVRLRAERAGTGDGRIYTIAIRCTDAAGNASSAAVTVRVPK